MKNTKKLYIVVTLNMQVLHEAFDIIIFLWVFNSAIIIENFRDNNLEWSNDVEGKVEVSADRDTNGGVDSKAAEFSEVIK